MFQETIATRLLPLLEPLQDTIASLPCRVAPSAFVGSDPALRAVPLPLSWAWPSLTVYCKALTTQALILQLPGFWQLEPFAFYAARAAEVSLLTIDPSAYALDQAALVYAGADAVLAEAAEAETVATFLQQHNVALPPGWILIHAADATSWSVPPPLQNKSVRVAHEVHLTPGIPLLIQCEYLVRAGEPAFHQSAHFVWDSNVAHPTIHTAKDMLFVMTNFTLPFALERKGRCACGGDILLRATGAAQ